MRRNRFKIYLKRLRWALTSRRKKQALMEAVQHLLSYSPNTSMLLEKAKQDNLPIRFSGKLIGGNSRGQLVTDPIENTQYIQLSPEFNAGILGPILIHELRHWWQHKKLEIKPFQVNDVLLHKRDGLLLERLKELDAYNFQVKETRVINRNLKGFSRFIDHLNDEPDLKTALDKSNKEQTKKALQDYKRDFVFLRRNFGRLAKKEMLKVYDRDFAVRCYYLDTIGFTDKLRDSKRKKQTVSVSHMRQITTQDVIVATRSYTQSLSDRQLRLIAMRHADVRSRKAVRLMDEFNKLSKTGDMPKHELKQRQKEIGALISRIEKDQKQHRLKIAQ